MSASPPPPASPRLDVRVLSLAQLHQLAERGSRRARAELQRRLRATAAEPRPRAAAEPSPATASAVWRQPPAEGRRGAPAGAEPPPGGDRPPAPRPAPTPAVHAVDAAPGSRPARPPLAGAGPAASPELLAAQLQLIAEQQRARGDGPPRLVGLVLIAWGVLLALAGLLLLARGGGAYYLACGLGSAAVGWLLMRCSRWALALHAALLALALAWAWAGAAQRSLPLALLQAAPLGVAALWVALRQVREALD